MNRKESDKLLLNLSLYLDNELSKEEMLEIEELLKIDPEVSAIFDSLRSTRIVLRNAPRIKRRRNFTLTSEHVKQVKKESGWVIGMRLVTSFSMILLLVVFTQNMLGDWSPLSSADISESSFVEDTADLGAMELAVQDSGDDKTVYGTDDAGDVSRGNSVEVAVDTVEGGSDDAAEIESNEFDVSQPIEPDETNPGCAIEEICGESAIGTDVPIGAGGGNSDGGDDESVAEAPIAKVDEESAVDDDASDSDIDQDSNAAGGQDAEDETEVETDDDSGGVAVIEEDLELEPPVEFDDGKDSTLLIVLVVFAAVSSGTYLFLRKKYS